MDGDPFQNDVTGWRVEFRGGPLDGPVAAKVQGSKVEMVAGATVMSALARGVGSSGELVPGGMFASGYKYEVVQIDRGAKLVVVELRPYR